MAKRLTYAQKKCVSTTGLLMQKSGMISSGTRIGIAVSGGVDSFVLLKVLEIRQRILPFPIELMILHVNPGFEPKSHLPLAEYAAEHGISAHIELSDFGPRGHSEENRKNSPCFLCARLRRNRLFRLCQKYGLTHLAIGHNADDLAVTFFMNIFQNGQVRGLSINESFFRGELQVIRPALLLSKKYVKAAARQWGLPIWENKCPSSGKTMRDITQSWLNEKYGENKIIKNNVLNALCRHQLDLDMEKV